MKKFKPIYGYKTKDYSLMRIFVHSSRQKLKIKVSNASDEIRILLTNKYNPKKLKVRELYVIVNKIKYPIYLKGKKRFKLKANQEVYSDTIILSTKDYREMTVVCKFGLFSKVYGASDFNSTKVYNVEHLGICNRKVNLGLRTKAINKPNLQIVLLIKQVEAKSKRRKTITWFGDSLTNHSHYTQALQKRIIENNLPITIVNAGHSGNRLLKDGRLLLKPVFGIAGIKRIEEDVFKFNQPNSVVVALGVNDLIHPATNVSAEEMPTSKEMIDGYIKLCRKIQENNSKAIIATITPFKGFKDNILPEAEVVRQEVNTWIKTQRYFDYIIDLDVIVRQEDHPDTLQKQFQGDDNLHFPAEGGSEIAQAIDLKVLNNIIS